VGDVRPTPGANRGPADAKGAIVMFLLVHNLHLTGPLAVLVPVAMIGLRLFLRRSTGRGRRN
jgi:hypothetical protein